MKKSNKIKKSVRSFRLELRKSVSTALIAAFSFLMALTWRDLIIAYVNKVEQISPLQGKLITAIIITVIATIGILIVTKLIKTEK